MTLPDYVLEVINRLEAIGFEAYTVGGCVRDYLLGQCPDDYDITTSALPEQIIAAFGDYKILTVGLKHGTVTVIINGKPIEITTFRIDGDYRDHRHPASVEFTSSLAEDLSRRDFTINAMAYSPRTGIIDLYGGREDLENKIIRCVGNPEQRFDEDGLRILRALRFASRYGFTLDRATADAAHRLRYLLGGISAERIQHELCEILVGQCGDILIDYPDIICEIIPEMHPCIGFLQHSKYHNRTVYRHIAATVAAAEPDIIYRLTMLLHDIGKPDSYFMENGVGHFYGHAKVSREIAERVLARLRCSNKITSEVLFLIENHGIVINDNPRYFRRALAKYGEERFFELIKVHIYDTMGKAPAYLHECELFYNIEKHLHEFLEKEPAMSLKQLAVSGGDIISLGFRGKEIGEALGFLLDAVLDEKCENNKEKLLKYCRENFEKSI